MLSSPRKAIQLESLLPVDLYDLMNNSETLLAILRNFL